MITEGMTGKEFDTESSFQVEEKELFFRVKLIPTTFDDGKQGVTIILEDITEQKRAEMTLRESEERYRTLFENAPVGILTLNNEGIVTAINPFQLENVDGGKPGDYIEKFNSFDFTKKFNPDLYVYMNEVLEGHKFELEEIPSISVNGTHLYLHIRGNPIFDENGDCRGGVFISENVSERVQAKEEKRNLLHDLEERVKEFNCLYGVTQLMSNPDLSFDEIIQGVTDIIPSSWQYPEITCAKIAIEQKEFTTAYFKETKWYQKTDISISGDKIGTIEVYYTKEMPEIDEGPFLQEERDLIETLALELDRYLERKKTEDEKNMLFHDLGERVKELSCLYGVSILKEREDISSDEFFQSVADLIPPSWKMKIYQKCWIRTASFCLHHRSWF